MLKKLIRPMTSQKGMAQESAIRRQTSCHRATGIRLSLIKEMDFRGNYISKEKTNTIDAFILKMQDVMVLCFR